MTEVDAGNGLSFNAPDLTPTLLFRCVGQVSCVWDMGHLAWCVLRRLSHPGETPGVHTGETPVLRSECVWDRPTCYTSNLQGDWHERLYNAQPVNSAATSVALWPPNPKELFTARCTFFSFATCGV